MAPFGGDIRWVFQGCKDLKKFQVMDANFLEKQGGFFGAMMGPGNGTATYSGCVTVITRHGFSCCKESEVDNG